MIGAYEYTNGRTNRTTSKGARRDGGHPGCPSNSAVAGDQYHLEIEPGKRNRGGRFSSLVIHFRQ